MSNFADKYKRYKKPYNGWNSYIEWNFFTTMTSFQDLNNEIITYTFQANSMRFEEFFSKVLLEPYIKRVLKRAGFYGIIGKIIPEYKGRLYKIIYDYLKQNKNKNEN